MQNKAGGEGFCDSKIRSGVLSLVGFFHAPNPNHQHIRAGLPWQWSRICAMHSYIGATVVLLRKGSNHHI